MRIRFYAVAVALGLGGALLPIPVFALGPPKTLADTDVIGVLNGKSPVMHTGFSIDFVGLSWSRGKAPSIRFLQDGRWSRWSVADEDDMGTVGSRTFSALMPAASTRSYQVRGTDTGVEAVAINTTDGPRSPSFAEAQASASHLSQPQVIPRDQWGADESYRFNADGSEKWVPAFYPTQKLIVHHTAGANDDPDPAATIRAIYRYHAIDKGWGDIGYNFLVDAQGRVYKGRYSGPAGTLQQDTITGEDARDFGVTGAHTSGYNSGTMGIAVLGTYTSTSLPGPARSALIDHLAWESERHGLAPEGSSVYVNPVNGSQKAAANISGHRVWVATECPGETFNTALPSIRSDVAAKVSASPSPSPTPTASPTPSPSPTASPPPDNTAPSAPSGLAATPGKRKISLTWTASSDNIGVSRYEVTRSASSTGPFATVGTSTTTGYTDTGLARAKTYWYRVIAVDTSGNRSAASNAVSERPN